VNKPTLLLLWSNIKMLLRDRQSLFWALVFPLIFLVIFGLFRFDAPQKFNVQIFDQSQTDQSKQLIDQITSLNIFTLKDFTDPNTANEKLKSGDLAGIITIPAEYGKIDPKEIKEPMKFAVVTDGSNQQAQLIPTILSQFLDNVNLQTFGATKLFAVDSSSVQGRNVRYIDFIMPGILGMGIMFSSIIGIAVGVTKYRERRVLKRLLATPVSIRSYLVSEVGAYLFLSLMQIFVILGTKFPFSKF
jgi:ABC-2 type transport system permease protein